MFGFSIFLQDDWSQGKENYVNKMADVGFGGIFTSLHIPEDDVSMYKKRLEPLLKAVKARNLKLAADISGDALRGIGLSLEDPEAIFETGFSGLRMDDGIPMETIANVSHYLTAGLNASTLTETDYEQLVQSGANFDNIEASHNYYPRPDTGLDEKWFLKKNVWLKSKRLNVSAFIPGNCSLRQPLYETLPTLEMHRHEHPLAASLSLLQTYQVDDVYIGDPGISEKTRKQFDEYLKHDALLLHAASTNTKWNPYIYKMHSNRQDVSRDVVRSESSRITNKNDTIHPENTVLRKKGSITIDNHLYNRYKGELQVLKRELPLNERVNVIGQVMDKDIPLLDYIQSGTTFKIADSKEAARWT